MNLIRSMGATLALCILVLPTARAQIPSASGDCVAGIVETTPSSDFTPLENGAVVRHETTGLEWRRCTEGMTWTGSSCTGTANFYNWQQALQQAHGQAGWRLPNINELSSIVEECRESPVINLQVFPNTPTSYFWSGSPYASHSLYAWDVSFDYGVANGDGLRSGDGRVRLVRGGQ